MHLESDVLARLGAALADRYRLERELGQGGMATVYLAEDLKHDRKVALKVLRPELAALLGAERFIQEIKTTAQLRHPHVLPLFDSGRTVATGSGPGPSEFLYYVMPFVEGETLRDKLERERQLSIEEALRITREVADALSYAHSRGIVHRDIKPENILLESGHAVVADFGIAKAVSAAGGASLTQAGMAVGTPQYMSPEQAAGDPHVDGRSDLYSLGCVLFEMLAGQPPFSGPSAAAIMASRFADSRPKLRAVRESVPLGVEQAIDRSLARTPADRFATVSQFAEELGRPGSDPPRQIVHRPFGSRRPVAIVAAAVAVLLVGGLLRFLRPHATPLDPDLMAVLPFRASGTDSSYHALREGMVDVLDVEFSTSSGARVVPAQAALAAWRRAVGSSGHDLSPEDARAVARSLGAGGVLLGTVVKMPGRLILSGSLLDSRSGLVRATAQAEGPPDSLYVLVDRFSAQLAALRAGERTERLASLTSTSLPALFEYLAGRAAHRAGQYDSACASFERALALDSTFALAALRDVASARWTSRGLDTRRPTQLAWAFRDRLPAREQVLLGALSGSRYPGETPPRERLASWESAVQRFPDDPDLWFNLGDLYFHDGPILDITDPVHRAEDAFRRAGALDTTLSVEIMFHWLQIAEMDGDTATVRRLIRRISPEPGNAGLRLVAAAALGDSALLGKARAEVDSTGDVGEILNDAVNLGVAIPEAERTAMVYLRRSAPGTNNFSSQAAIYFYVQLGRPTAALAARDLFLQRASPLDASHLIVYALYGLLDSVQVAGVVERLLPISEAPAARDPAGQVSQARATCSVEWWRLSHGDTATARARIERLGKRAAGGCAYMLDALLAAAEHRTDAGAAFDRLDSLLQSGGGRPGWTMEVVRWREAHGDDRGALLATNGCWSAAQMLNLSYCLRAEGRLAARVGDRSRAIRAYSRYLALRYDPEPSVKPEVDAIRAELARLQ